MSDETKLAELDELIANFETYLKGVPGKKPSLRLNWVYLQLFATYGLRLPHTKELLLGQLNLEQKDVTSMSWFSSMVDAYEGLNDSSQYFLKEVFTLMTDLGSGLSDFASDAAGEDSIFTFIETLIQPGDDQDLDSALEELADLKSNAADNDQLAAGVQKHLLDYQGKLKQNEKDVGTVKEAVENDENLKEGSIDVLQGGPELEGSIKKLQTILESNHDDYDDAVLAMEVTPSYGWITPIGGAVAAYELYANYNKMEDALDAIDDYEGRIENLQGDLDRAIKIHTVDSTASKSLAGVLNHLEIALEKTDALREGWKVVADGLDYLFEKVNGTLKPTSLEEERLAAISSISHYMRQAQAKWSHLSPVIEQMTSNAIISVEGKPLELSEIKARILAQQNK